MNQDKNRTCFVITGHVDHGKSTFVGRLLTELEVIPKDRFENLVESSKASGKPVEYAHLTDALAEEKNRGITIGVSNTLFRFEKNEFVFIDAPGHYEFLQNMITGASRADFAFLLIDAKEGVMESTLRHMNMLSFLGIKDTYVLINKMDLVAYSQKRFTQLVAEVTSHAQSLNLKVSQFLPISAYYGENLVTPSPQMPWYKGLLVKDLFMIGKTQLDNRQIQSNEFLFVVHDTYDSTIVGESLSGEIENGQTYTSSAGQIRLGFDENNYQGKSIKSYKLLSDTKLLRGDIIHSAKRELLKSDNFNAVIIWFGKNEISAGTPLVLRLAKQEVKATIDKIADIVDGLNLSSKSLDSSIQKGYLVNCMIKLSKPIFYDHFENQRNLGKFVLLHNGQLAGAGKVSNLGSSSS